MLRSNTASKKLSTAEQPRFAGLSVAQCVYIIGGAIDGVGNGLYVPIATLYFVVVLHLSGLTAGVGLSAGTAVGMALAPLVGASSERVAPWHMAALWYSGAGLGILALVVARSEQSFLISVIVARGCEELYRPARRAIIPHIAADGMSMTVAGRMATAQNVAFGCSLGLAAVALASGSHDAMRVAIGLNGVSNLATAGAFLWVGRAAPGLDASSAPKAIARDRLRSLWMDRPYLTLAASCGLLMLPNSVLLIGLPLWVAHLTGVPHLLVAACFALNVAQIALFQTRISDKQVDFRSVFRALGRSGCAMSLACVAFAACQGLSVGPAAVSIVLAVGLLGVAELYVAAGEVAASLGFADPSLRQSYVSTFSMLSGFERALGPVLVATAVAGGRLGWLCLMGMPALGLLGVRWARPRLVRSDVVRDLQILAVNRRG